jgi:hypothetical protein
MTGSLPDKTVGTISSSQDSASDTTPTQVEKSYASHAETVGQTERNAGLRIDGDDLDHMHEPKVCSQDNLQARPRLILHSR